MGVAENTTFHAERPGLRRKPQRLAPKSDEIIAQIHAHHGILSPAAKALGLSRSSLDRMVQRRGKLAMACRQAREGLVDFAEGKLFEKIREGNERCIIFALSSPIARARGWGAQGAELVLGDAPRRITEIVITVVDAVDGRPAGQVIEHRPVEDADAADSLVLERTENNE